MSYGEGSAVRKKITVMSRKGKRVKSTTFSGTVMVTECLDQHWGWRSSRPRLPTRGGDQVKDKDMA